MDKKLKSKWIKALTSGRYKQTREELRDATGGGYCCLGVLLSVSRKGSWDGNLYMLRGKSGDFCEGDLGEMKDEFGIPKDKEKALIRLNDGDEADFKTIASYIRKNL
jgi:hypothetical protein